MFRGEFLINKLNQTDLKNIHQYKFIQNKINRFEEILTRHIDDKNEEYTLIYLLAVLNDYDRCFEVINTMEEKYGSLDLDEFKNISIGITHWVSKEKGMEFINKIEASFNFKKIYKGTDCSWPAIESENILKQITSYECYCLNHDDEYEENQP